jgi:hypothetical protein
VRRFQSTQAATVVVPDVEDPAALNDLADVPSRTLVRVFVVFFTIVVDASWEEESSEESRDLRRSSATFGISATRA